MDSLYLRAARGLVREFHDPYTELYSPAEWVRAGGLLNGNISGIGVNLQVEPSGVYFKNGPPWNASRIGWGAHRR